MEAITCGPGDGRGDRQRSPLRKSSNPNITASNEGGLRTVHDTPSRRKARELKAEARELEEEAAILAGIRETEELGAIKANRANELKKEAKDLNQSARLENITVRQNPITRQTKKKGIGSIIAGYFLAGRR
jgi:hypothetical protein